MRAPVLSIFTKDVAKKILDALGISKPYLLDFEANNQVYLFEDFEGRRIAYGSDLYQKIEQLERERHLKVYAVTHDFLPQIGESYSFLCVSPYPEDWDLSMRKIGVSHFSVYAYVQNVASPERSESGFVLLHCYGGGIRRVG